MFTVKRKIPSSGAWQESILSPFKNKKSAYEYCLKYGIYYPEEDRIYKIQNNTTTEIVTVDILAKKIKIIK